MEGRLSAIALVFTIIAACSKPYLNVSSPQPIPLRQTAAQKEVYTSGWENIPSWTAEKKAGSTTLSYSHNMPGLNTAILEKGAVLVFVRNLWPDSIGEGGKPLILPFYFLPYFEKPDYMEEWNYTATNNNINVTLLVKGGQEVTQPDRKLQVRYIIIPGEQLKAKKQTSQEIRKLAYNDLVQMFALD